MKRKVNVKTARIEWTIDKWYEKTAYIIGVGYTFLMVGAFIIGFMEGLMGL